MSVSRRWLALLAALLLFAGACGGDSADPDDDGEITIGDDGGDGSDDNGSDDNGGDGSDDDGADDDGSDDDGAGDDGGSGDDGSGGESAGGDFMTVYGLPPGDATETDWAPYEATEDETGSFASVTFEMRNTTVEEILAHYQASVPAMGYTLDEALMFGTAYTLPISDPANSLMSGLIEIGEIEPGVISVHHNKSAPNPPEGTTDDGGGSATGSSGGDGASEESITEDDASPAVTIDGLSVTIDWMAMPGNPFYAAADPTASDPFFHIHSDAGVDGPYFSVELYTVWGAAWTGDTGIFEISCSDPNTSTGICPYFDPDGPGPMGVLGGDFMTTGAIQINELGPDGYDIDIGPIIYSDGTVVNQFKLMG